MCPLYRTFIRTRIPRFITANILIVPKTVSFSNKIEMEDKEALKNRLTSLQWTVTQEAGTERPYTGCYDKTFDKGTYVCVVCQQELFSSESKFDSGCGWPAFSAALDNGKVTLHKDVSLDRIRTEVRCAKCTAHLGHVFEDGPPPTRKRFCINSASLDFITEASQQDKAS